MTENKHSAISTESKVAFLASLEELRARSVVVGFEYFNRTFQSLSGDDDFLLAEWKQVVAFCSDQANRWQVEWHFSPASAPDLHASKEFEAWLDMWRHFSTMMSDQVPELGPLLERQHNVNAGHYLIARKLQHDAGSPWARMTSSAMSTVAISLNKIGLRRIGRKLYKLALFPAGSVGRAGA
jgi:hypothetical protein